MEEDIYKAKRSNFLSITPLVILITLFITFSSNKTQGATGQINTSARRQILDGFGGANVWSSNTLPQLGNTYPAIYDVIFGELGLDILRLRNVYQYDDSSYIGKSTEVILDGRARTGRPLKIMMSSWSPKKTLKSNSSVSGGGNSTLAKDFNDPNTGSSGYVYQRYAQWWYDSIADYNSRGVRIDYASMQNEPDYDASWDSCRFNADQNSSIAGYKQAFAALYTKLNTMPESKRPRLLGPETAALNATTRYINAMSDTDKYNIYGYNHHLYDFDDNNPDGAIPLMTSFAAIDHNDKPLLMTELGKEDEGGDVTEFVDAMMLALYMHNSLAVEGVSSYIYWELTYGAPEGLVSITTTTWTINPVYYAMKHYSAFTDPNWQRIDAAADSCDLRISAYISPDNNQMSIVIINKSASSDVNLTFSSLGNFEVTDGNIYRTDSNLINKCAFVGAFDANTLALTIPKYSFTTIALKGKLLPANCQEVQSFGYRLLADLNSDCHVNFEDLLVMTSHWLETAPITVVPPEHSPDIHTGADNIVNFLDFADLANQWLTCNVPNEAGCISNW